LPQRHTADQTVDDYPASKRLPARACVHCHQVYEFRRSWLQAKGAWTRDDLWVYPLPENVGLTLDVDRGNIVTRVAAGSPAGRLGLRPQDEIIRVGREPVASIADLQWGLHQGPKKGSLAITWRRAGEVKNGDLELPEGWRETDLSWRWSLRSLDPPPWVHGEDLTAEERQALGLSPKQLALRQGPYVLAPAEQAGIRQNDIIIAIDGKSPEMTGRQLAAYIRLNYKVGDRITYTILRRGERLEISLRLQGRNP
jgi:S1-C subfamily serine protease